jgi:putative ABC transport system permease protein
MKHISKYVSLWFPGGVPLAWRQLIAEKKRFSTAVAGVAFGIILMLFQLGIYQAFMVMVLVPIDAMKGDLAMISRDFQYIMSTEAFPERRLYQALASPEVKLVYPVMIKFGSWRHPETGKQHEVALIGVRSYANPFTLPGVVAHEAALAVPDGALYDELSTPDYGAVADIFGKNGVFPGEINKRRVRIMGTFRLGQTLAAYGHIVVGAETFRRITSRKNSTIEIGMIEVRTGADPQVVAEKLNTMLPEDVEVVTRLELSRREQAYWQDNTPIGFIVTAGMVIAMFVGAVIVYQILYADISDHIKEYATLKALGMGDGFFVRLILQQAAILPFFAILPSLAVSAILFLLADSQGGIPTQLTVSDTLTVLALTAVMCLIAGMLAVRRLRAADPADIF